MLTRARYYGDELCFKLALISVATTTHTVFLQCPSQRLTEDRPVSVEDWKLSNQNFIRVFDGAIRVTQRRRNQVFHQEFYDWKFMRLSYTFQNRYYCASCSDRSIRALHAANLDD